MRITVDKQVHIRLEDLAADLARALRLEFTYPNPEYHKKQKLGLWVGDVPRSIGATHRASGALHLPRGCLPRLREALTEAGLGPLDLDDRRSDGAPLGLTYRAPFQLDGDQLRASAALLEGEQGILLGPCGSGKTEILLHFAAAVGRSTLVAVHTDRILASWLRKVVDRLGVPESEVGVLTGNRPKRVAKFTVGTIRTLLNWIKKHPDFAQGWGTFILDEAHHCPAGTFFELVGAMPARWRVAATATPRRKDGKQVLFFDAFGWRPRSGRKQNSPNILYEINDLDLDASERIVPVEVVVVPTDLEFDLYNLREMAATGFRRRPGESSTAACRRFARATGATQLDYHAFLDALSLDRARLARVLEYMLPEIRAKHVCMALGDRTEVALRLRAWLERRGHRVGGMLGTTSLRRREAAETEAAVQAGTLRIVVATTVADEGMDLGPLSRGFALTPTATNPGRLTQQFGRFKRLWPGKVDAVYFYFWDHRVLPLQRHLKLLVATIKPPHRVSWSTRAGERAPLTPELLRGIERCVKRGGNLIHF